MYKMLFWMDRMRTQHKKYFWKTSFRYQWIDLTNQSEQRPSNMRGQLLVDWRKCPSCVNHIKPYETASWTSSTHTKDIWKALLNRSQHLEHEAVVYHHNTWAVNQDYFCVLVIKLLNRSCNWCLDLRFLTQVTRHKSLEIRRWQLLQNISIYKGTFTQRCHHSFWETSLIQWMSMGIRGKLSF